jgi:carbon-monoxide dehydrogenase medium subunit
MYDFAYQKPASLADAVKALSGDADAKALAGGQTYIPVLKQRLAKPSTVVDLSGLGLAGITVSGNTVTIGAMTRHCDVAASADVKAKIPALAGLASHIGDEAVRHRGTIGGSLANNDPAADYPASYVGVGA